MTTHHALSARMHTDQIDHLATMIEILDHRIEDVVDPFAEPLRLLQRFGVLRPFRGPARSPRPAGSAPGR